MPFHHAQHIPQNVTRVPAMTTPQNRPFRVALCYKNFPKATAGSGHVGLGITANQTTKYLQAKGIYCEPWGISTLDDLKAKIELAKTEPSHIQPLTHVVISAPFLSPPEVQTFVINNPSVNFAIVSHSNIGFLQADPGALRLISDYSHIEAQTPNFQMGGNSDRLTRWFGAVYKRPCWVIPNLYMLDATTTQPHHSKFEGDLLRVGCFGAQRILKNILTAGAAAAMLAANMGVDLEFWISSGRMEGGQSSIDGLRQMFSSLKWAKVKENSWEEWSPFRQTVAHMDLLMQPSYTESFNVVTADGVACGVPSVVSAAIDWAPASWKAANDDPESISRVGEALLHSRTAASDGLAALTAYNEASFQHWLNYLHCTTPHL